MPRACCVIGGSAGGISALRELYSYLPKDLELPLVVILHLHPSMTKIDYSLTIDSRHTILEAQDKDLIRAGQSYFAPASYHLLIERDHTFALSVDSRVNCSRPSIDVLFESASDAFGSRLLAVILSGANSDGALGAKKIAEKGGKVLIQDPKTASYEDMPRACCEVCPQAEVKTIKEIAEEIKTFRG